MKISMFHLQPHRDLPEDFEKRYEAVWVTPPWWELADAEMVGRYYNWTIDELVHAAKAGFDGICTNEHHQNAYGFMPNPNLIGAILAKLTDGIDVAIVQMGSTLPTSPPIRVAEEYAMIDCISGGRLVAGMPLGTSMDANFIYGVPPMDQRPRWREAHDFILKAWTTDEIFAWNGRHYQYPIVNVWPRPIQKPYPPVWVPGAGSVSTAQMVAELDHVYCFLSYFGAVSAKNMVDRFWEAVDAKGIDTNPYRLGFLQLVCVAETDERAEVEYARHVEYFYHKMLHLPLQYFMAPGHMDYQSMVSSLKNPAILNAFAELKSLRFKDFNERCFVIAGSPATVRDRMMEEVVKGLRCGNLMVLLQIGSMPHDLALKNIDLFAREVLPDLRGAWEDEGWENRWWPKSLQRGREPVGV
jgi:alkanesulfonate monooxygenase SsuD/methylene tetrahydromethanopterin reductase-like flavin-dependent oxidoreductase (luciferase family)